MSDPKLIEARERITAVLRELDVAGVVVLHSAPNNCEAGMLLNTSYSVMRHEKFGDMHSFRIRTTSEDFGGDVEAQKKALKMTHHLVGSFGLQLGNLSLRFLEMDALLRNKDPMPYAQKGNTDAH